MLFTLKYAPQNSNQIFGQQEGVAALKDFIINYTKKSQRAALLYGPIGNGKTSSVYAVAKELGYDLLEINSSDLRNEESMKTFLGSALGQQSLFFRPKIILIDEIDNISGAKDRGCIPALLKLVEKSTFPIIVTANDLSDSKFKALLKACLSIEYPALDYKYVAHALKWVCEQENIVAEDKAINSLARQADGDLRAALLDLHICAIDKKCTFDKVLTLSDRKRTDSIMNAMTTIFKSSTAENALPELQNVDMELRDVITWLDENLPREYINPPSLARAYGYLARADVFQGRITRRQHWRFLVYMNDLLTAGISTAKEERNTSAVPYQRTMRFLQMWQAKMKWGKKKEIAAKLAAVTHTSTKEAMAQVPYVQAIVKQSAAEGLIKELDLSEEEVEWMRK
ncbi:MAG TPA: replication factor C large subunit [Candidatus Nanoarchaeia archaeon]|nr:replication factor C large subunit [Candidatus Nanoarchaeia archaeon]